MKIVRYDLGDQASRDVDCAKVEREADGRWILSASALVGEESVSFVGQATYASREAAEEAAIAWAAEHGVRELHLEVMPGC